jgi:iron complex transport system permease protein
MTNDRLIRFSSLITVFLLLALVNLGLGPVNLSLFNLVDPIEQLIFLELRLPKTLMAISAGGLLGVAGLFMQTYFQNPLVGPYILGVHSGAGLGVAAWYLIGGSALGLTSLLGLSSLGSLGTLFIITLVAPYLKHKSFLLIFGLLLGQLLSGALSLLTLFSPSEILRGFMLWGMGSFERMGLEFALWVTLLSFILVLSSYILVKPLNALMMGEEYAHSLGVNVRTLRISLFLFSGLMASIVAATCGPIAFVGVIVPHIARWFWGDLRHQWLIVGSFLIGAIFCLFVQALSLLFLPHTLPVNVLLSLVSAPVLLVFLIRLKGRSYAF